MTKSDAVAESRVLRARESLFASRARLGAVLREARSARALSLSDVARETEISTSFLSLVENGKSDIAIGRLVRLLAFYDLPVDDVIGGPSPSDAHTVRQAEARLLPAAQEGIEFLLLTSDTSHSMMPMLIVFEPGAQLAEHGCHEGEEFVHVLEGALRLELEGTPARILSAGDSAYYQADCPHLFKNASRTEPLRILCVDTPPNLQPRISSDGLGRSKKVRTA